MTQSQAELVELAVPYALDALSESSASKSKAKWRPRVRRWPTISTTRCEPCGRPWRSFLWRPLRSRPPVFAGG